MPIFGRAFICTKEADCPKQTKTSLALIRVHNSVEMTQSTRQKRRKRMRQIKRTHQKVKIATRRKKILRTQKILDKRNLSKTKCGRRRSWRTLRLRSGHPCNSQGLTCGLRTCKLVIKFHKTRSRGVKVTRAR